MEPRVLTKVGGPGVEPCNCAAAGAANSSVYRPAADALAQGNIDAAAQLIAGALPGNTLAINTAATLAPAEGLTTQLAQAASLAVTKYGADASAVAAALSEVGASAAAHSSAGCRGSCGGACRPPQHAWHMHGLLLPGLLRITAQAHAGNQGLHTLFCDVRRHGKLP